MAVVTTDPFAGYRVDRVFDEMLDGRSQPRRSYRRLHASCSSSSRGAVAQQAAGGSGVLQSGASPSRFTADEGTERIFPYDLLPRIITAPNGRSSSVA